MKKFVPWLAALLLATGPGLFVPAAASTAPYCDLRWGSLPEVSEPYTTDVMTGVRSGRHACFDRLVVDLDGDPPGYDVRYAAVHEDGSGDLVPLRGRADLRVVVRAPAYEDGLPTYVPADRDEVVDVEGYDTFRQVAWAGSFEGQTTLGVGVRAHLPFRVFVLDGPGDGSRLVVDVAHRW